LRYSGIKTSWRAPQWLERAAGNVTIDVATLLAEAGRTSSATAADSSTQSAQGISVIFESKAVFDSTNELNVPAYFVALQGLNPKPSPGWIRRQLEALEQNSVNDVVDLSNLVLLTFGQPSHAFDFNKLAGGASARLRLRRAHANEDFVGLDAKARKLHPDDCVVTSGGANKEHSMDQVQAQQVHALLGVIGGEFSKVDESTRSIIVEWANPDPVSVRRTSRRIGRKTDSSFQFEKGLDRAARLFGTAVFLGLLRKLHPQVQLVGVTGIFDDLELLAEGCFSGCAERAPDGVHANTEPQIAKNHKSNTSSNASPTPRLPHLVWTRNQLDTIAGTGNHGQSVATWEQQIEILGNLGFRFFQPPAATSGIAGGTELTTTQASQLNAVSVLEPHWRSLDIDGTADLCEEIVRVVGIDSIAGIPISGNLESKADDGHLEFLESVASTISKIGYTEVSSFHFMKQDDLERLGLGSMDALGAPVHIINPTLSDEPYMQTSLIPDLLRKVRRNLNSGTPAGRLFHVCRTFQNLNLDGKPVLEGVTKDASQILMESSYGPQRALAYSFEDSAHLRPAETPRLSGAAYGLREAKSWNQPLNREWVVQDFMAQIRDLGLQFGVKLEFRSMNSGEPFAAALHPKKAVSVFAKSVSAKSGTDTAVPIGWIGQLHPRALRAFEIDATVFAFELNLAELFRLQRRGRERPVAEFRAHRLPLVRRDFAIVLAAEIDVSEIESSVRKAFSSFVATEAPVASTKGTEPQAGEQQPRCRLNDFRVFDVYVGEHIAPGKKSVAFEITVEPFIESLSDAVIQRLSHAVVTDLESNLSAVLRS
jgi:phenylalanyl-tRNA synthetase beta chain